MLAQFFETGVYTVKH